MKRVPLLWVALVLWSTGVAMGWQNDTQVYPSEQEFRLETERLMTRIQEVQSRLRQLQGMKMPTEQLEDYRLQVQQRLQELDRELVQAIKQREALKKAKFEKAAEARIIKLKRSQALATAVNDEKATASASASVQTGGNQCQAGDQQREPVAAWSTTLIRYIAVYIANIIHLFAIAVAAMIGVVAFKLVRWLVRITPSSAAARVVQRTSGAITSAIQCLLDKVYAQWHHALGAFLRRRRRMVRWGDRAGEVPLHLLHANLLKRLGWTMHDVHFFEHEALLASLQFQLPARVTLLPSQLRRVRRAIRLLATRQAGGKQEPSCHPKRAMGAVEQAAVQRGARASLVVGMRELFWMTALIAMLPCLEAPQVAFVPVMRAPRLWRVKETKKLRLARRHRQAGLPAKESLKLRMLYNVEATRYLISKYPNGEFFLSVVPPYRKFPVFVDWLKESAQDAAWAFWTSPTGLVAAASFARNGITRDHADWLRGFGVKLPSVPRTA